MKCKCGNQIVEVEGVGLMHLKAFREGGKRSSPWSYKATKQGANGCVNAEPAPNEPAISNASEKANPA